MKKKEIWIHSKENNGSQIFQLLLIKSNQVFRIKALASFSNHEVAEVIYYFYLVKEKWLHLTSFKKQSAHFSVSCTTVPSSGSLGQEKVQWTECILLMAGFHFHPRWARKPGAVPHTLPSATFVLSLLLLIFLNAKQVMVSWFPTASLLGLDPLYIKASKKTRLLQWEKTHIWSMAVMALPVHLSTKHILNKVSSSLKKGSIKKN